MLRLLRRLFLLIKAEYLCLGCSCVCFCAMKNILHDENKFLTRVIGSIQLPVSHVKSNSGDLFIYVCCLVAREIY